jgi:hypothetical protein
MGFMHFFTLLLFWIFFGFCASYFAEKKGRNPLYWFFIGLFLGLIGVVIILLLPKKETPIYIVSPKETVIEATPPIPSWHYFDAAKQQQGPVTLEELKEKWDNKELNENSYIWSVGMENWKTIKDLPEVMYSLTKTL